MLVCSSILTLNVHTTSTSLDGVSTSIGGGVGVGSRGGGVAVGVLNTGVPFGSGVFPSINK